MKDEIKEILEDYKKLAGEITEKLDNTAEYENWLIIQDYFDKLLDYITNLQEKNERLKEELQQEKKDFKEANDYCFELKDYKSRNEKALEETKLGIQVLEDTKESYPMISCDVVINRYLKPILKSLGEDKDVKD